MARRITVHTVPFDYRWPDRSALTAFTEPGEYFVKDEVADFATAKGYATEGRAKGSTTRSVKGKVPKAAKRRKTVADAQAADDGRDDRLDDPRLADDGGADDGRAVDPAAE